MKKEERTVYIADDGKAFLEERAAYLYEEKLNSLNLLEKYRIPGPEFIATEPLTLKSPQYRWYEAKNRAELEDIKQLLAKRGIHIDTITVDYNDPGTYPEIIGFSTSFETAISMSVLKQRMDRKIEQWNEFLDAFQYDPEKKLDAATDKDTETDLEP